jgi:hypothetical protein
VFVVKALFLAGVATAVSLLGMHMLGLKPTVITYVGIPVASFALSLYISLREKGGE